MSTLLFYAVTACLFLRPGEIFPSMLEWPVYNVLISACMLLSIPRILRQLNVTELAVRPATVCVLGVWGAIVLSLAKNTSVTEGIDAGTEFSKTLVFYLLLIGTVNTVVQLKRYLWWLALCISILATIPLLKEYGFMESELIGSLEQREVDRETGEISFTPRLQGTGFFNDPNDLSIMIVVGIALCLLQLLKTQAGATRLMWGVPIAILGVALLETQSRGGLMALAAALMALFYCRYGARKALMLGVAILPFLVLLSGGRQTDLSAVSDGTGQARVQLWSQGMDMFREYPLFGAGQGQYVEHASQVAHNSFIHGFAELGFFGGSAFLGAFVAAVGGLLHRSTNPHSQDNQELERIRPFLVAAVAGYGAGLLTLSRNYVVSTYLILGLATVWATLACVDRIDVTCRFGAPFLKRVVICSLGCLFASYLFIRLMANWS